MTTTTVPRIPTDLDRRLDDMAAQLAEVTTELRRQRDERERWRELADDLGGLGEQALATVSQRLAEWEHRGYLEFAGGGLDVADRVATSFDRDDVEALGDNIVLILKTVKEMTQPEIMFMLRRTAHLLGEPDTTAGPPSLLSLVRDLRDPEVRRGLARLMALLRTLGRPTAAG